jgi:DNA-binding NtrC family response regulator
LICRDRAIPSEIHKEGDVKDQLEALILQMHKSGILYAEAVREFKKRFIMTVLQENKGNQCKAARQLGMHRNTLSRTIVELDLDVRTLRPGARRPPRSARPTPYDKRAAR